MLPLSASIIHRAALHYGEIARTEQVQSGPGKEFIFYQLQNLIQTSSYCNES